MQVNTGVYVEISIPDDHLSPDPSSSEGGAILRVTPEEAKELARRLTDAVKDCKRKH